MPINEIPSLLDGELSLSFSLGADAKAMLIEEDTFKPEKMVMYEITNAPKRPHRKKRIRKKWAKKYGWKTILVYPIEITDIHILGPGETIIDEAADYKIVSVSYKKL